MHVAETLVVFAKCFFGLKILLFISKLSFEKFIQKELRYEKRCLTMAFGKLKLILIN